MGVGNGWPSKNTTIKTLPYPPSTNHISSYNNVYFPRYKLEKIWDTKKKRNADTCGGGGCIPWHLGGRSKK